MGVIIKDLSLIDQNTTTKTYQRDRMDRDFDGNAGPNMDR